MLEKHKVKSLNQKLEMYSTKNEVSNFEMNQTLEIFNDLSKNKNKMPFDLMPEVNVAPSVNPNTTLSQVTG